MGFTVVLVSEYFTKGHKKNSATLSTDEPLLRAVEKRKNAYTIVPVAKITRKVSKATEIDLLSFLPKLGFRIKQTENPLNQLFLPRVLRNFSSLVYKLIRLGIVKLNKV